VTEAAHRFGGIVFHLRGHELGHLHGETVADLPFPPHLRDELVAGGRATPDHGAPDSAWVSRRVERPHDVAEIVELFRMSYEYAASQPARVVAPEEPPQAPRGRAAAWRDALAWPLRRRDRP
jgi:hypothetical protein